MSIQNNTEQQINFWERLEMFVKNVQVNDAMSEEEKEMILSVCKSHSNPNQQEGIKITPQEYYEKARQRGLTEDITSNPEPHYEHSFYQSIFRLMEGYKTLFEPQQDKEVSEDETDFQLLLSIENELNKANKLPESERLKAKTNILNIVTITRKGKELNND